MGKDINNSDRKQTVVAVARPPVVTVMGHIDHGKSTLLDYLRKTNIVEGEAGGITQYLSAYEVAHKAQDGVNKKITFLDTPGHMAFASMRSRGAKVADVAILVVSAEDGVKEQTMEAYRCIEEAGIPFVVAITKIDKPNSDVERTKLSLVEKGIYLEGLGGKVSFVPISSKSGEGVSELMDMVLLLAEMEELRGDPKAPAEGYVIESHVNPKRGVSATLIITNGLMRRGMYIVADGAIATARIMENFAGKSVEEIGFSSPVRIVGFSKLPPVGVLFKAYGTRKLANEASLQFETKDSSNGAGKQPKENGPAVEASRTTVPIVIKADVLGTAEAVVGQIESMYVDEEGSAEPKVLSVGVGAVNDNDILKAGGDNRAIIIGFNVKIDATAQDKADRLGVTIASFNIIYELTDWLSKELKQRTPKITYEEIVGKAKILRSFSRTRDKQVVGGKVIEGELTKTSDFKVLRRDKEIGRGKIVGLQQQKVATNKVEVGNEFGMQVECRTEIATGDIVEAFDLVVR